jgi:hypothetical protein
VLARCGDCVDHCGILTWICRSARRRSADLYHLRSDSRVTLWPMAANRTSPPGLSLHPESPGAVAHCHSGNTPGLSEAAIALQGTLALAILLGRTLTA